MRTALALLPLLIAALGGAPAARAEAAPAAPSVAVARADSVASAWRDSATTLVFVVRHAEKSTTVIGADPPLSDAGVRRAQALAHALGDAGIRTIYVNKFARVRQTAESLAARTGAEIRVVDQGDPEALARRIRAEHAGQAVLIVGHSDTVPAIVAALSGRTVPPFVEGEWDPLYLVTLPRSGPASVLRLKYGEPRAPEKN